MNLFRGKSFSKKRQKGFTLIELVLYVGILSILIGVMTAIFGQIVEGQLEAEASSATDQDGRYVLGKMIYDMKSVNVTDTVVIPASPGVQTSTLQLQINSINYTYSLNSNGDLILTNGTTGEVNKLNSVNSSISGLNFQRLGAGGTNDTVRVNFTVTSRNTQSAGPESKSFETTLARQ